MAQTLATNGSFFSVSEVTNMIPSIVGRELEERFASLLKTQFRVREDGGFRHLWEDFFSRGEKLIKGPYLELPLPYRKSTDAAALTRFSPAIEKLPFPPVTQVSHNHPEGIKGAEATSVATFLARTGKSKDEIRATILRDYYPIDFTLDEIRSIYRFDVSCQGSVPQALEAFFESDSFEDAIRNAISIGGDSDTIAAIAGAVAGAYYGIPNQIKAKVSTFLDRQLAETLRAFKREFVL